MSDNWVQQDVINLVSVQFHVLNSNPYTFMTENIRSLKANFAQILI